MIVTIIILNMLMFSQDNFILSIKYTYVNDVTKLTLIFYASPHVAREISSHFANIKSLTTKINILCGEFLIYWDCIQLSYSRNKAIKSRT